MTHMWTSHGKYRTYNHNMTRRGRSEAEGEVRHSVFHVSNHDTKNDVSKENIPSQIPRVDVTPRKHIIQTQHTIRGFGGNGKVTAKLGTITFGATLEFQFSSIVHVQCASETTSSSHTSWNFCCIKCHYGPPVSYMT